MMLLSQIASAISGRPSRPVGEERALGVSTDSRTIRPGDLFFALRGARFDAHEFLEEAFARGAVAAVVDREGGAPGLKLRVDDTLEALGSLAAAYRMTLQARVTGIAGSNGKTTTKEMVAHILREDRKVVRAQGSFNNQVGVPHTIFQADGETQCLVLEIGTNHPGEISRLGRVSRPDIGVLVSVGAEHLEGLGSLDGVADEETSLLGHLRSGGFAVLHDDPRILGRVCLPPEKVITFGLSPGADFYPTRVSGMRFTVRGVEFELPLLGEWNIQNALAASAVAMLHGIPLPECARRLADFKPPKMRMERLTLAGITIINDAYNSNPESASRAIREFGRLGASGRKVAVIGDMLELGGSSEAYHRQIGLELAQSPIDVVVAVGQFRGALLHAVSGRQQKHGFGCVEEMRGALADLVHEGDAILLKGSRGIGLERLVKWVGERQN
jgi:UDP-N-acetylmuramoyl-tripeptide--D-alanyl-D-alanine ligase